MKNINKLMQMPSSFTDRAKSGTPAAPATGIRAFCGGASAIMTTGSAAPPQLPRVCVEAGSSEGMQWPADKHPRITPIT
jgi:hypothetical protein